MTAEQIHAQTRELDEHLGAGSLVVGMATRDNNYADIVPLLCTIAQNITVQLGTIAEQIAELNAKLNQPVAVTTNGADYLAMRELPR